MAAGTLRFGPVPRLPEDWWTRSDDEAVFSVWDRDTLYLWGANADNRRARRRGEPLAGGGMAGPNGPTRGRAHPRYVGVDTMSVDPDGARAVFDELGAWIDDGRDVLVPTLEGRCSLGTGIAARQPGWAEIQRGLFEGFVELAEVAGALDVPSGTFWPDCRVEVEDARGRRVGLCERGAPPLAARSAGVVPIGAASDLSEVVDRLRRPA